MDIHSYCYISLTTLLKINFDFDLTDYSFLPVLWNQLEYSEYPNDRHVLNNILLCDLINEPRREKTGLRGFRPGPTQTGLYKLRKELEA